MYLPTCLPPIYLLTSTPSLVSNPRQISLARSEGRPLLPPERDDEQRQLVEQQQAELVDGFLAWDFDADTAATFFAQQVNV